MPQTRPGTWRLLVPFRQDLLLISNLSLGTLDSPNRNCITHGCSGPRANGIFSSLDHSGANCNATAFQAKQPGTEFSSVHQKLGKNRGPTGFHDRLPAHKSATLFRVLHYCDRSSAWCSVRSKVPKNAEMLPSWSLSGSQPAFETTLGPGAIPRSQSETTQDSQYFFSWSPRSRNLAVVSRWTHKGRPIRFRHWHNQPKTWVHWAREPSTTILGTTVIRVRGLDSGTARHSANRAPRIYRCAPGHALKCGGPYLALCAFSCRSWLRCPLQSRMSNHSALHCKSPRIQPKPLPDPDRNSSWEVISSSMAWWLFCYLTDSTAPCDGGFPSPPRSGQSKIPSNSTPPTLIQKIITRSLPPVPNRLHYL